ncbi:scavenger receptor class b type-1 sr-b1 [Holotrichia oblita]|uniref:Scavenger receptor class b type-1 sr-b1 n=1 Tax=Holotrichia oblita TaxID=644536 RepID=A0ACB9T8I5_HOLOL|nr:scavenger receptor class b type-1 sr-b1 [Holotrichia oblita]
MYKHCPVIIAITGFIVLAVGVLCTWYGFPRLVDMQIKENIAMQEGTQAFDFWKKQPFPLSYKVYFFNVTNPQEIMSGENPIVKEVGPYIYE